MANRPPLVIIGPTAAGKSAVALELARVEPSVEIISADSMQVYRGMDIGTAKPSLAEQTEVRHHVIDIVDPSEEFGLAQFQEAATAARSEIEARDGWPVIVGGTGLYVQAVVDKLVLPGQYPEVRASLESEPDTTRLFRRLQDLDPLASSRMESTNRRRILRALEVTVGSGEPFSSFGPGMTAYPTTEYRLIGIDRDRSVLDERIAQRYEAQIAAGFLDEIEGLLAAEHPLSATAAQALGYKELIEHVRGHVSLDEALELANKRTRRFARRQQRWFRRDPRITWLDGARNSDALAAEVLADLRTITSDRLQRNA